MSAASKAAWRARNPERSREAERDRAHARRWDLCASSASYWKYEESMKRYEQRLWYPIRGAGGHHMTVEQGRAAIEARFDREWAALGARFGLTPDELAAHRADIERNRQAFLPDPPPTEPEAGQ